MEDLAFVSLHPKDGRFEAQISLDGVLQMKDDPENALGFASRVYDTSIRRMRKILTEIDNKRASRSLVPARAVWRLGDAIWGLTEKLAGRGVQVDGLYGHLCRDLGVKRKWLEKVVIFRRYIPDVRMIPGKLNWGRCEKGTRRHAERIAQGLTLD